jgi:HPt (histidine-containing phosphotransfer) domain-containing protein
MFRYIKRFYLLHCVLQERAHQRSLIGTEFALSLKSQRQDQLASHRHQRDDGKREAGMNDFIPKLFRAKDWEGILKRRTHTEDAAPFSKEIVEARSSIGVLNRADLLEMLMGSEDVAQQILDAYLDDTPGKISSLKEALARKDMQQVQFIAHSLKSSSATIRASTMANAALDMETAGREVNVAMASSLIPILEEQYSLLEEAIRESSQALKGKAG